MGKVIYLTAAVLCRCALVVGKGPCDAVRNIQQEDHQYSEETSIVEQILPPLYNKDELPKINGKAVEISVGISVAAITEVRENTLDMDFVTYIHIKWFDCRLIYNFTTDKVYIPKNALEKIWKPDLYFRNVKDWKIYNHIEHKGYLIFYEDKHVLLTNRYLTTSMCYFNFRKYPFDSQECGMDIESYAYTNHHLKLKLEKDIKMDTTMPPTPQFDVTSVSPTDCTLMWDFGDAQGGYDCLGFVVKLQRRYNYFIWQVYFPSGILVTISWLSFWIDVTAVPGRVALAITTLLTLSTTFAAIQKSLPPVSYLKAIDVWIFACMIFVFLSLVEFVMAITWEKDHWKSWRKCSRKTTHFVGTRRAQQKIMRVVKSKNADWVPSLLLPLSNIQTSCKSREKIVKTLSRAVQTDPTKEFKEFQNNKENIVDKYAKYVFFFAFIFFNILYWTMVIL